MNATRVAALSAVMVLAGPVAAWAQPIRLGADDELGLQARTVCFRPAPLSHCRSFLLTQARFQYRLSPESANPTRWYLTGDVGWMMNVSERSALGMSVFGGPEFGFEEIQYGVKARYRRWLGERTGIDVSLGTVLGTESNIGRPGFTGAVEFNMLDLVSFSVGLDYTSQSTCALAASATAWSCGSAYGTRTYVGATLGSQLGIAAYSVAGMLGLLVAAFAP